MTIPPDFSHLNPQQLPSFVIADELRQMRNEQAKLALESLLRRALLQEQPETLIILAFACARWLNYRVSPRITDEFLDLSAGVEEMRMQ